MTDDLARARTYAQIFIGAGDQWPNYVPDDGEVAGPAVRLGAAVLTRVTADQWRIECAGQRVWVKSKALPS